MSKECNSNKEEIKVNLSLKPSVEELMLDFEKELIREDIENFPTVKVGDITFKTVYVFDNAENIEVSIYVYNGLSKSINFQQIPFTLMNSEGEIIIKQSFDMRDVGMIPPYSVRPYKLHFNKKNLLVSDLNCTECRISVDANIKAIKTLDIKFEEIPENITVAQVKEFEQYLDNLPTLKDGEISINTYEVSVNKQRDIYITFIIRNGIKERIKLETIPITVLDANSNKIVGGVYDVQNVQIGPRKAVIYNFVFTSDEYSSEGFDMSNLIVLYQ